MSAIAVLPVLASGFLHAVWNLLTKRSGDKKTFLWAAQTVSALLYLTWAWHDLARTGPTPAPVAVFAPMREIGTVFGAALGIAVLKERGGVRRLLASGLITAGVIALGAAG